MPLKVVKRKGKYITVHKVTGKVSKPISKDRAKAKAKASYR